MCDHQNIIYVEDTRIKEIKCNECGFIVQEGACKCAKWGDEGLVPYCSDCNAYLC